MSHYGDTPAAVVAKWREERAAHLEEHRGPDCVVGLDSVCWICPLYGMGRRELIAYRTALRRLHIMNLASEDVAIFHGCRQPFCEVRRRSLKYARSDLSRCLASDWEVDREAAARVLAQDVLSDVERLVRGLWAELGARG